MRGSVVVCYPPEYSVSENYYTKVGGKMLLIFTCITFLLLILGVMLYLNKALKTGIYLEEITISFLGCKVHIKTKSDFSPKKKSLDKKKTK